MVTVLMKHQIANKQNYHVMLITFSRLGVKLEVDKFPQIPSSLSLVMAPILPLFGWLTPWHFQCCPCETLRPLIRPREHLGFNILVALLTFSIGPTKGLQYQLPLSRLQTAPGARSLCP